MNFWEQMERQFEAESANASEGSEEAYSSDFSGTLSALRSGRRVCRSGWNGKGMWLALITEDGWDLLPVNAGALTAALKADGQERICGAFIGMKTADDKFVPWLASQTDILAGDWEVMPEGV